MTNIENNAKSDKNIQFLKLIIIALLSLFILLDIGINRQEIILFHYGILLIIFYTIGTLWIKISSDGIKFGNSNAKEKEHPSTSIKYYDNRKIYYPADTTSSFPDNDNNDLFNNLTKNLWLKI